MTPRVLNKTGTADAMVLYAAQAPDTPSVMPTICLLNVENRLYHIAQIPYNLK